MKLLGYPFALRPSLKFDRHSSEVVCEGFVLRSLIASPLIKPRFTPRGWQEVKCVYWKASVGFDVKDRVSLKSISPLYIIVSRKVISLSEISAVYLIEGWNLLACSMNKLMPCLFLFHREKRRRCNVSILLA